jgi:ribosomal protein S18 acetylase RimI-like enzyme
VNWMREPLQWVCSEQFRTILELWIGALSIWTINFLPWTRGKWKETLTQRNQVLIDERWGIEWWTRQDSIEPWVSFSWRELSCSPLHACFYPVRFISSPEHLRNKISSHL